MNTVRVGILGSQFVSTIHAESLKMLPDVEVVAVASRTEEHAREFAKVHDIPNAFTDYRKVLEMDEVDMIALGIPNDLHHQVTLEAAASGKHIVCEKPLCLNLEEADSMIAACRKAGVKLMYAEQICFAPKYVRLKQLLDEGALGEPTLIKQCEKHDGPHADHFWDVRRSGGGVAMDMGCHAIEFFRWLMGKDRNPIRSVYAQMNTSAHADRTAGEDNALIVLEFESGCVALAEESWSKLGGMDDRAEIQGTKGVACADLIRGNSIPTYSAGGYGYAVEKAGSTKGWSFAIYEEVWNYGFPQEFAHFVDCVRNDREPFETGEDGRKVLEVVFAAYESARIGKKVMLPFETDARRPIDLWKPELADT